MKPKELIFDLLLSKTPTKMKWSFIDRWGTNPKFIDAYVDMIERELLSINPDIRDEVIILFSAHSLPMEVEL